MRYQLRYNRCMPKRISMQVFRLYHVHMNTPYKQDFWPSILNGRARSRAYAILEDAKLREARDYYHQSAEWQ